MSDDDKALDLAELRRVAEAATEGPWQFEPEGDYECGEPGCCTEYWDNRIWGGGVVIAESHLTSADDSQHIATFDPPTVLALLDRLEVVEEERDTSDVEVRLLGEACDRLQARAEAAEAKVARVEALVTWLASRIAIADGSSWSADDWDDLADATMQRLRAALRGDAR